jgi:hypothetical protein
MHQEEPQNCDRMGGIQCIAIQAKMMYKSELEIMCWVTTAQEQGIAEISILSRQSRGGACFSIALLPGCCLA